MGMQVMRLAAAVLVALLLAGPPAGAQQPDNGTPGQLFGEATEKLMQALRLMLQAIPQYAAPEINENGDIIIRRLPPRREPAPAPPPPGRGPDAPIQTGTPTET